MPPTPRASKHLITAVFLPLLDYGDLLFTNAPNLSFKRSWMLFTRAVCFNTSGEFEMHRSVLRLPLLNVHLCPLLESNSGRLVCTRLFLSCPQFICLCTVHALPNRLAPHPVSQSSAAFGEFKVILKDREYAYFGLKLPKSSKAKKILVLP